MNFEIRTGLQASTPRLVSQPMLVRLRRYLGMVNARFWMNRRSYYSSFGKWFEQFIYFPFYRSPMISICISFFGWNAWNSITNDFPRWRRRACRPDGFRPLFRPRRRCRWCRGLGKFTSCQLFMGCSWDLTINWLADSGFELSMIWGYDLYIDIIMWLCVYIYISIYIDKLDKWLLIACEIVGGHTIWFIGEF
jgi:hypothetical protein